MELANRVNCTVPRHIIPRTHSHLTLVVEVQASNAKMENDQVCLFAAVFHDVEMLIV
jgi:microcompartment protein CcmL/EutN